MNVIPEIIRAPIIILFSTVLYTHDITDRSRVVHLIEV